MQKTNISEIIKSINSLISENVLKVTPEKYLVIISKSLWVQFEDKSKQTTFLRNLSLFCKLTNAHSGSDIPKQNLQMIVKDENNKVVSLYELDNRKVNKKELEPLMQNVITQ